MTVPGCLVAPMLGGANIAVVDAADFDGTNDYMLRGADLTGNADSKSGIISVWVRLDGGDAVLQNILTNGSTSDNYGIILKRDAANTLSVLAKTSAQTTILLLRTVGLYTQNAAWRHVLASWDLATAGARSLYITDVSDLNAITFTNGTIDYTKTNFACGALPNSGNKLNGALAEVYFAPGQYLDFSVEANRRKFISSSGKPVNLGADGSTPTGVAPIVYFHLGDGESVANFATNRGTGGNFTITGTLDAASSSPSD